MSTALVIFANLTLVVDAILIGGCFLEKDIKKIIASIILTLVCIFAVYQANAIIRRCDKYIDNKTKYEYNYSIENSSDC